MNITLPLEEFQNFLLILSRVSSFLAFAPLFGTKNLPRQLKVGLALLISIIIFPFIKKASLIIPSSLFSFGLGILMEIMMGAFIGFSLRLIFAGVQLAGQLVGFQMGFAIVNVLDPQSSSQVSIVAELQGMVASLVFLTSNAHHWFLKAMVYSFQSIPPLFFQFSPDFFGNLLRLSSQLFLIAIKIGAPLIAALLFTQVILGLLARTIPQMNIFIVGFPLQIAIGLLGLGLTLPFFSFVLNDFYRQWGEELFLILRAI